METITVNTWEKYLLIQHDENDFMDYWLKDETLATSYKEARNMLFSRHGIAIDDLNFSVLTQTEYKSKF